MIVRPAELEDLEACLSLDHSYHTGHVWQMEVQDGTALTTVSFRAVRLPRPAHVHYPRNRKALLTGWHSRDCFLVAVANDGEQRSKTHPIVGYLTMSAYDWHQTGWVADMVIAPRYRRQGIATQLLQAGKEWARKHNLRRLTTEMQTKNHPAMCFLEKAGFTFCGYNDHYYANQDIALFYSLDLR